MSADDFQKDAQIVCSSPKDAAALCHFHHPVVVISRRGTRLNSWECSDVTDRQKISHKPIYALSLFLFQLLHYFNGCIPDLQKAVMNNDAKHIKGTFSMINHAPPHLSFQLIRNLEAHCI